MLENVTSVSGFGSCSDFATMAAIKSNGDLYCWGRNPYGQVGNGSSAENQRMPVKVLENVVSVSGSGSFSTGSDFTTMAAITSDGGLYCWGSNYYGMVGNGSDEDQRIPVKVLENVTYVSGSAAITSNGDLYCWGNNECGEVGNGSTVNQGKPVKVLGDVAYVSGSFTKAAITQNGDLYCWGYNQYVGNGSTVNQALPAKILNLITSTPQEKAEQRLQNKYGSGRKKLEKQVGSKLTQKVTGAKTAVTFSSSDTKVAKVGKTSGVITCVGVGKAVITSRAAESGQYKTATSKATIYVIPKTANIKSVRSSKKGQVTITGTNGANDNDGYQIQYKHNGKTRTVKAPGKKSITRTFKNLKSRKDFKVRMRAYKKVKGETYYGIYSKWRTLKKVR